MASSTAREGVKKWSRWGLSISVVFLWSFAAHAQSQSVLFYEDYETQDLSAWSGADENNPDTINGGAGSVVSTHAHSGLYSYQATLPASGGTAKLLETIPSATEIYLRYYLFIPSGFSMGSTFVISNITPGGAEIALRTSGGNFYLQDWNGNLGTHSLSTNTWHAIEVHSKTGSGNGIEQVWIDGTLDINLSSLAVSGPFTTIYLGPDNADGTQNGSLYFDDAEIATSGPLGAPTANLTVRYPNMAGRSALPVDVVLFGTAASDTLIATVDGSTVFSQIGSMTGHQAFSFSVASLSVGSHSLQVQLQSSSGTTKATFAGTIYKYVNGVPAISIDGNNIIYKNGAKYFAAAPFIDGATEWSTVWLANKSVNTYGWQSCYTAGYAYTYSQFNSCMNTIAASVIGPDGNWTGVSGSQLAANASNAVATATAYVVNDNGNSNLYMWSWGDEPDVGAGTGQISPQRMTALMDATHSNDGNHPVITNYGGYPFSFVNDRRNGWYFPIVPGSAEMPTDVLAFDMYPIIYQTNPWYVTQLVSMFDRANRYTYNLVPWAPFIEAGICDAGLPCAGYGPTASQANMEAWLAVIHGAKGVSWWGPAGWTTQDAAHWAVLGQFETDTTHFTNQILSTTTRSISTNQQGTLGQDARVDCTVREDSSNIYAFCARLTDWNESGSPLLTQISIGGSPSGTAAVYNEGRNVNVSSGVLTDTFSDGAVHIYQLSFSSNSLDPPTGLAAVVN